MTAVHTCEQANSHCTLTITHCSTIAPDTAQIPPMHTFLHFTTDKKMSGVERYGRILETGADKSEITPSIELDVGASRQPIADLERSLVAQYSPHLNETQTLQTLLDFAKAGSASLSHKLIVHDANNLPPTLAEFFSAKLYRKPRTLLKALNPTAETKRRNQTLRNLAKQGFHFVVFTQSQIKKLPFSTRKRCHCVPHFVEAPEFSFEASGSKNELGLENKKVLTILGFVNRRKQNELLIHTLQHLPVEYHLVLAGGAIPTQESYIDELHTLVETLGLSNRFSITGYLQAEEQCRYIAATDLAICTFNRVSASGSLSTWIAHEKPILASDLSELQEYNHICPNSLTLTQATAPEALAKVIEKSALLRTKHQSEALKTLRHELSLKQIWKKIAAL